MKDILTVSVMDIREHGCPYCGYFSGRVAFSSDECIAWICGDSACGKICCGIDHEVEKAKNLWDFEEELQKQEHPKKKYPISIDKKEEIQVLGTSTLVTTASCFVCGHVGYFQNWGGVFQDINSANKALRMFPFGAKFGFHGHRPKERIVQVGACKKHSSNLEKLKHLIDRTRSIMFSHVQDAF